MDVGLPEFGSIGVGLLGGNTIVGSWVEFTEEIPPTSVISTCGVIGQGIHIIS